MSSDEQNQRQRHGGRLRRIARAMARPRLFLLVLTPLVATALVVALLPRGVSLADTAPSDDGVTWSPSQANQGSDGNGQCWVQFTGGVNTDDITNVINAMSDEPKQTVNQDNTQDYFLSGVTQSSDTTVTAQADVGCSIVQTALRKSLESRAPGRAAVTLTALTRPAGPVAARPGAGGIIHAPDGNVILTGWFSGAIADLAATAAYIAISAVTIGTMIALGATLGPAGELASPVLGALAGCIGGAVSTAILLAIGGGNTTPLGTVTNAAAGCVTGAALSQIPVHEAGQWIASQLNSVLGSGASAIGGSALESAASSAGVSLSPMAQAMSDAVAGLGSL